MFMTGEIKGVVLRFERTSMHDGPGLRTVLFLKGCPLACRWCSTPESQKKGLEKGFLASSCTACGTCVEVCPTGALWLEGGALKFDRTRCTACFACVDACPQEAHKGYGRIMTVEQAVEEICKDEIFYFHSGGGVTVSGGECLLQPDFVEGVLTECRLRGIDTAVETSLHAPWRNVERILPGVNTFYFDIKHPDPNEHRRLVGVDNTIILDNLYRLDGGDHAVELYMRIPLVPGVNDSEQALFGFSSIAARLRKIKGIEILPYHRLGSGTYRTLGREYLLDGLPSPPPGLINERLEFLKRQNPNLAVKAGGGFA
jgi:pyruvate formate lyase activating enzyme